MSTGLPGHAVGTSRRVDTRTVGVEEELLVVDPARARDLAAREVLKEHAEHGRGRTARGRATSSTRSCSATSSSCAPTRRATSTTWSARSWPARRTAGEAAAARDLAVAACAAIPLGVEEPEVTPDDRYRDMVETFGEVARLGTTCGMHVHVAIESPEEGVGCLDRIAPWLPVLLAMSANSPYVGRPRHRIRVLADPAVVDLAERRADRGVRVAGGLPARLRADDRQRRGARPRDALLRRPALRGAADARGPGPRRGHRPRRHRPAGRPGARARRDRRRAAGRRRRAVRAGGARSSGRRAGGPRGTAWPTSCSTRRATSCGRRGRWWPRWSTSSRRGSTRPATPTGWRAGVERVLGATGATRQRAAYERTGSVEGVVDDLLARTADSWASPNGS